MFDRLPVGPLDLDQLEAAMEDDLAECILEVLRSHLERLDAEIRPDAATDQASQQRAL